MRYKSKQAFSVSELLIALMIVAILFAATAPILTKRQINKNADSQKEPVWNTVNGSTTRYFFDPNVTGWESVLGIGMNRSEIADTQKPDAISTKFVVKANSNQNHIQFRNGDNKVGFFTADNKDNMFLGSDLIDNLYKTDSERNTVLGYNSATMIKNMKDSTIIGSNSLTTKIGNDYVNFSSDGGEGGRNTIVGGHSAKYLKPGSKNNIILGAKSMLSSDKVVDNIIIGAQTATASGENNTADRNIIIGSKLPGKLTRPDNIFLGAYTQNSDFEKSVVVGSSSEEYPQELHTNGTYKSSKNLKIKYFTAIGYQACRAVQGDFNSNPSINRNPAPITCIGVGSASRVNPNSDVGKAIQKPENTYHYERVFLGGDPDPKFNGAAVLEIHNPVNTGRSVPKPKPIVIINGNLMVRNNLKQNGETIVFNKDDLESQSYCASKDAYGYCSFIGTEKYYVGKYSSDIRLKENILPYYDSVDKILALTPYNYTFKADETKTAQVGVTAQGLQKVFANSVIKDKSGYLKIRWDEMFFTLINAVKELNARIETLVTDVMNMDKDNKNIKQQHKDMKKQIAELNARASKLEKK